MRTSTSASATATEGAWSTLTGAFGAGCSKATSLGASSSSTGADVTSTSCFGLGVSTIT
ncbi:hypothetical protein BDZ91DRAFT_731725 [Kalaharituber pfeilii]|nr:hypothetical protein BDZ91DRAFT_731725 [Kalaharituber pfeilii]